MLKLLQTMTQGALARTADEMLDRNAMVALDQQIRAAVAAYERSRRALALAIAHGRTEERRLAAARERIRDLEQRAIVALHQGREDLAATAAQAIAALEVDCDALRQAREVFDREVENLRQAVHHAGARLADVARGRRVAAAADAVRRLASPDARPGSVAMPALGEAEATLRRLRDSQAEAADIAAALRDADGLDALYAISGDADPHIPNAAKVLDRLKMQCLAAPANTPATAA